MWRRKTIQTVGGWQSRTTVEDMDLSLRAYVNGWKAIYLTDTTCTNEVRPPGMQADVLKLQCSHPEGVCESGCFR